MRRRSGADRSAVREKPGWPHFFRCKKSDEASARRAVALFRRARFSENFSVRVRSSGEIRGSLILARDDSRVSTKLRCPAATSRSCLHIFVFITAHTFLVFCQRLASPSRDYLNIKKKKKRFIYNYHKNYTFPRVTS